MNYSTIFLCAAILFAVSVLAMIVLDPLKQKGFFFKSADKMGEISFKKLEDSVKAYRKDEKKRIYKKILEEAKAGCTSYSHNAQVSDETVAFFESKKYTVTKYDYGVSFSWKPKDKDPR